MIASALDRTIDALVAAWQTALSPSGWKVIDGDPYDPGRKFLCVGWDETSEEPVTVARTILGPARELEVLEVRNLLTIWAGDKLTPAIRNDAWTAFNTVDQALAADPTLGHAVTLARITEYGYRPDRRPEGALAQVRFTVTVKFA